MYSCEPSVMAALEPLHYAVLTRNVVSVEEQLQRGADVLTRSKDGDPRDSVAYVWIPSTTRKDA